MPEIANIVVLEDNLEDQELLRRRLTGLPIPVEVKFLSSFGELRTQLTRDVSVLVTDYRLAGFTASDAMAYAHQIDPDMPVLVVTGAASEAEVLRLLKEGAFNVVSKSSLPRLDYSLLKAIRFRTLHRQLQEQERHWRALIENSSDAIVTLTAKMEVTYCSPAIQRLLGYSPAEVIGKNLFDFLNPEDHELSKQVLGQVLTEPTKPVRAMARVRHANGTWRIMEGFVNNRLSDPAIGAIVDNFWDVTELQNTLQNLRLFDECLRHLDECVVITDAQLKKPGPQIIYANPAVERLTGYKKEELLGKTPRIFQGPNSDKATRARMREALEQGKAFHGDMVNYKKDGSEFLMEMNIAPIYNAENQVTHFVSIQRDVTQVRKNQEIMARSDRIQTIGFLSSGIAHDLNNILAPITMGAELMRMDKAYDDSLMETIANSAERGKELVKHLLAFARGTKGQVQTLSVAPLLKEMGKLVHETFPKDIQWQSVIEPGTPDVCIEPAHLHQILLNLCVNARDAMPSGGILRVTAGPATLDEAQAAMIPNAKSGVFTRINVEDTGCGISTENMRKIFDPFFTTKEAGKGTGIGLPTVLGLVESHGGFMKVQSELGKGTAFEVYLPASKEEQSAFFTQTTFPAMGRGETILVVDDEPSVRNVSERILIANGYNVLMAENGADALGVFARQPESFKVVLTDLMMPHLDGLGFVRALRRLSPGVPVVAMTGVPNKLPEAQANELGLHLILVKPFSIPELLNAISSAIHSRS